MTLTNEKEKSWHRQRNGGGGSRECPRRERLGQERETGRSGKDLRGSERRETKEGGGGRCRAGGGRAEVTGRGGAGETHDRGPRNQTRGGERGEAENPHIPSPPVVADDFDDIDSELLVMVLLTRLGREDRYPLRAPRGCASWATLQGNRIPCQRPGIAAFSKARGS